VKEFFCNDCGTRTTFKPFQSGLYKYGGERVQVCKTCGLLRTVSELSVPEEEIVHMPTQKKRKERQNESED
jgi:hypothetical protein